IDALRAVLELDRGDLGAAAADLAAVAATGTAPFSRWLAAELAEGRQPTFAAPNDAPTPDNSADRYVAALFWLRSERVPEREIAELLGTIPDLDRRPGFAELQLAALMIAYDPAQDGDVVAFRQRLNARAAAIDALRGGMSAMTAQVRLNALLGLELYAEARDLAEQAIALAPEDFILHKLRAETEFFRGRYEAALAPLRQTLALQPRSRKTHELLVLAELYSGDVAAAEHTLTHPGLPMAPARLAFFEGLVLHEKAFRALAGETALGDASELAAAAADAFARSRDEAAPVSIDELACRALIDPSPDIVTGLLRAAADSALDPRRLQQLSNLLGEQLDQDQTAALVDLLRRQARQLRTTAH
ncbi:MAG: hypothetical protein KDE27_31065, partial [Planctomycetes bacterium]|nr:hypothetical protein [Planctomycetota bacterium]